MRILVFQPDWSKIDASGPCWLWRGSRNAAGYGLIWVPDPKRGLRAHRVVWEALVGPIPEGLELDHLCRVRHCVNPDHLEPVTRGENQRRGFGVLGLNYRKTHCPKGHRYDEAHTYRIKTGGRRCRTCNTEAAREYRRRKKEVVSG